IVRVSDHLERRGTHPGYPVIGGMRGPAELRGVMAAVEALEGNGSTLTEETPTTQLCQSRP
ncbi:hypothetical protein, partial [Aurantimonas marina]|uniref:hypothetical protein n=1 Tax=Aurantimonas marina TaxID=2780508 RepID=UPI0019D1CB35